LQTTPSVFDPKDAPFVIENIVKNLDLENGGQKGSPKFPMPALFDFVLRISDSGNADKTKQHIFLNAETSGQRGVNLTLEKMDFGGIYDQIGGGFARYATDSLWQIPHFEKMLYDNAQLVSLYSHAFQATMMAHPDKIGKALYEKVVRQTLDFVEQNWLINSTSRNSGAEGGFYSSFDADSPSVGVDTEGGEGYYYTWTKQEIDSLLGKNASIFNEYYGITEGGNFENGRNILSIKSAKKVVEFLQNDKNLPDLNAAHNILLKARNNRPIPNLDDKILTAWNALMLKGYVDAYKAFGEQKYLLLSQKMADYVLTHFEDKTTGFFHFTANDNAPLVARPIPFSDDVIPNANATIALSLNQLGSLLEKKEYSEKAFSMMQKMYETAITSGQSTYYHTWCKLYFDIIQPPFEVAIVGQDAEKLRDGLMRYYLPNALVLGGNTEGPLRLLEGKWKQEETYIYVCQNKACKQPVKTVKEALKLIMENQF
jgi:uncharacterized protein